MSEVRLDREELLRRHERRRQLMVPADPATLAGLTLFQGIPEKAREKVIEKVRKYLHVVRYEPGDTILREGEYSDSAFYVMEGRVEVVLLAADAESTLLPGLRGGAHLAPSAEQRALSAAQRMIGRGADPVRTAALPTMISGLAADGRAILGQGEIFGELSALSRYPVSATVRPDGEVTLLQVRLPGLRMLLAASPEFRRFLDGRYRTRTLSRHLRSVSLFREVEDEFLDRLKDRAALVSFEPGQVIVQEGAPAGSLLLVRGGFVKVSVRAGASDLAITYLRKGDYAGEAGLLLEEDWPFTLQALEHVEIVEIGRADFEEILAVHPGLAEQMWEPLLARLKARGAVQRDPVSSEYVQMAMETGLIHGESVLLIDLSTCTRCDECVRGCADAHGGEARFVREGERYRHWLVPTSCYQCTDPVCMVDCPTGAITREVGTLEVTIHESTCIGCGNCAERCPWGNIVMVQRGDRRPDGKPVELATKCDLCLTRPEGPACVQMCPHGSAVRVSFKDLERVKATLG